MFNVADSKISLIIDSNEPKIMEIPLLGSKILITEKKNLIDNIKKLYYFYINWIQNKNDQRKMGKAISIILTKS